MNIRMVLRILGYVLGAEAVLMLLPLLVCLIYGENPFPFLVCILGLGICAGLLRLIKPRSRSLFAREGFLAVSLAWILVSLAGAVPFVLDGAIPSYIDALFETVSGFTTTG